MITVKGQNFDRLINLSVARNQSRNDDLAVVRNSKNICKNLTVTPSRILLAFDFSIRGNLGLVLWAIMHRKSNRLGQSFEVATACRYTFDRFKQVRFLLKNSRPIDTVPLSMTLGSSFRSRRVILEKSIIRLGFCPFFQLLWSQLGTRILACIK